MPDDSCITDQCSGYLPAPVCEVVPLAVRVACELLGVSAVDRPVIGFGNATCIGVPTLPPVLLVLVDTLVHEMSYCETPLLLACAAL